MDSLATLLASGDTANRVPVIAADLRRRYPTVGNGEVVSSLEAAFCPVIAGLTGLGDAEKQVLIAGFATQIRAVVYSETSPQPAANPG